MDLKILEFNGIRKFYHNQLLTNESKNILNEQWFRFQIIKICEILSIETHDELNISLSNELLCDTIKKKLSRYVDKKIQETNKELLIQYGLDSSNLNNNLPISSKPLTESILIGHRTGLRPHNGRQYVREPIKATTGRASTRNCSHRRH